VPLAKAPGMLLDGYGPPPSPVDTVSLRPERKREHRRDPLVRAAVPRRDGERGQRDRAQRGARQRRENTCLEPDETVCQVQPLALAADRNLVRHNRVTGNDSFGIAVANICLALGLSPSACAALDIDPGPGDNRVIANVAAGKGTNPAPTLPPVFGVDLTWDLSGTCDCSSRRTPPSRRSSLVRRDRRAVRLALHSRRPLQADAPPRHLRTAATAGRLTSEGTSGPHEGRDYERAPAWRRRRRRRARRRAASSGASRSSIEAS
jgi:hypothetical protein